MIFPSSIASITNNKVIIFVTEAIGSFSWVFFSYKMLPEDRSIKIADFPPISIDDGVVATDIASSNTSGVSNAINS